MTTLDPDQTAALYRAANERRLGEVVAGMLGERDEELRDARVRLDEQRNMTDRAERTITQQHIYLGHERTRAEAAERDLAEARGRLAAVEALADEWLTDPDATARMCGRQLRGAIRAALIPDADA